MTGRLVVFRADASVDMGTGHVMRCLTLADALSRDGWRCGFICRQLPGHLGSWISKRGYPLWSLSEPTGAPECDSIGSPAHAGWLSVPWSQDAAETVQILEVLHPDWLVVDHYALDYRWEQTVRPQAGGIVVIDDLADRRHDCQWLLDQNPGRTPSDYNGLVSDHCHCLTGLRYALLRDEFVQWRPKSLARREGGEIGRVLVTLGGADPDNVTGCVLSALAGCGLDDRFDVDVVMGPSAVWLDKVRTQVATLPFSARVEAGVSNMAERMGLADVAIGAAGATTWERCCLGLPSLVLAIADNQRSFLQDIDSLGLARVGDLESLEVDIQHFMDDVRRDTGWLTAMSKAACQQVDGQGAARVAQCLRESVREARV